MNVPLRLVRRAAPAPLADAFLLLGDVPPAAGCARLGGELPAVHPVAGGFVLVPGEASAAGVPGAVRLRRVGGDVFVPVDADLVPALLPDELAGLSGERGLVFAPGGAVLAFDPEPLAVPEWLAAPVVERDGWEPFPDPPHLADRLTVIERPARPIEVEDPLGELRPGDADPLAEGAGVPDDARPPAAGSPGERLLAGGLFAAGSALAWLGKLFGGGKLARAGADMARKAIDRAPRLTEKLLGEQEAALREVLRQLRAGDVNRALRRAPIAVADPDAGPGTVDTGAKLNERDPRFDLRSLVTAGSGGSAWLGGGDVWDLLAAEYRRLASEASGRGDHRRAAYLYGVLLRDARSAANALLAGNLCRPAAILLRDKVKDIPAAAAAFDRAGDADEAVRLYERVGDYEAAARVLKRAGDDERALEYFARAVTALMHSGRYVAAGDLARQELGAITKNDPEFAARYYSMGWLINSPEQCLCGERLLDWYAAAGNWPELEGVLELGGELFAPPRHADAARFFRHARTHAAAMPADLRADLDDRTRLLFARHLRESPGASAGELFGRGADWPGPVVRDATVAAKTVVHPPEPAPDHPPPVRLVTGPVQAVAVAWSGCDPVVVGGGDLPDVVVWRPTAGRAECVTPCIASRVLGLCVDNAGQDVYILTAASDGVAVRCFSADGSGRFRFETVASVGGADDVSGPWFLAPIAGPRDGRAQVDVFGPKVWTQLFNRLKERTDRDRPDGPPHLWTTGPGVPHDSWQWVGRTVTHRPSAADPTRFDVPWTPAGPFAAPTVEWLTPERAVLEVCGVTTGGSAYWSRFDARATEPASQTAASLTGGFVCAALVTPGVVVAATADNRVHTLRPAGAALQSRTPPQRISAPARVVALVPRAHAGEVVAVLADGTAVRLPRG